MEYIGQQLTAIRDEAIQALGKERDEFAKIQLKDLIREMQKLI